MTIRYSLLILTYGVILIQATEWDSGSVLIRENRDSCSSSQFKCKNGDCIASELLCDGKADCKDRSDETREECSRPEIRCHRYAFRCTYGACVDGDAVCNGVSDCVDGSDELLKQCSTKTSFNGVATSPHNCTETDFKCKDGQCIDDALICDGKTDCNDRSDETHENCASSNCQGLSFRCAYGACIDGDLKCNGVQNCADGSDEDRDMCSRTTTTSRPYYFDDVTTRRPSSNRRPITTTTSSSVLRNPCRIPPQPEHGQWKLHRSQCSSRHDCDVDRWTQSLDPGTYLVYSCNNGFKIEGNKDVFCGPQGMWANVPKCVEIKCESLNSASIQAECTLNNQLKSCDMGAPINTVARLTCRNSYRLDTTVLTRRDLVTCNSSGEWEPQPIRCIPECGVTTTKMTAFVVKGTPAKLSDFPWHATLYKRTNDKIEFLCGATIVQANVLITAAHCVYNENQAVVEDASIFFVATGNVFQDFYSQHHEKKVVKKAKVKNIYVQCYYLGFEGNYARDIAILQIEQPFTFSAFLMPICLDTTGSADQLALTPGNLGRVAGFGRTATGSSSSYLQTISVPYVSPLKCKSAAGESDKFITLDKFCAGYDNGSSVCDGDSGGGLVFNTGRLWYLQGIVSAGLEGAVLGGTRVCDSFTYTLYTRVSYHISWIQDIMLSIETNKPVPPCPKSLKV